MNTKQIVTGATGSGKTYHTINKAKSLGSYAYLAPCRQLAYEIYIDYARVGADTLSTGEVKMGNGGDFYGVYESFGLLQANNYTSLIIDEAHYITDYERGGYLAQLVNQAKKSGVNIFLVTATRNFPHWRGWELVELQPNFQPPKRVEISYSQYIDRVREGVPSIEFKKYKSDAMLSADTLPSDRLQLQLDYRAGKIKYVSSTNVLAQGINMPCENLYIEYNLYDPAETLEQKLGRLGRMGYTSSDTVTYCISCKPKKIKKNKKKAKRLDRSFKIDDFAEKSFTVNEHEVPNGYRLHGNTGEFEYIQYSDIRYSRPFFLSALQAKVEGTKKEYVEYCLTLLNDEQEKIKSIILNYS